MVRFHPRSPMEDNKKTNRDIYKPVLIFYAKTTSWTIFPALLCVLFWRYFGESLGSQISFFVVIFIGFGITVYGIYREINIYKKNLEKEEKEKQNGNK